MTETEARIIITDYLKKISKETPPEYIGDDQQCYFYTVRYLSLIHISEPTRP